RQGLERKPDSIRALHEKHAGDKLYTAKSLPALPEPGVARPVIRRKCRLPDGLCADKWCCANLQRDGIQPAGSGGLRRCGAAARPLGRSRPALMKWPGAAASVQVAWKGQ